MKRVRLWLRELTLAQQLLAIVFLVVSFFSLFCFVILAENINEFVDQQMYDLLHQSQAATKFELENYRDDKNIRLYEEANIRHILLSNDLTQVRILGSEEMEKGVISSIISAISTKKGVNAFDAYIQMGNSGKLLYSVVKLEKNDVYLVSLLSDHYQASFRDALINGVINVTVLVVSILFIVLTLWVSSIIHPLQLIRHYINTIGKGQPAQLKLHRRDEIGEVADALVTMQKELERQEHSKEEMLQNISHDLKTPIATIKSYSESIKDGIYPYGTLEDSIDVILEHADRLEKKVYSLIMLNKMDYLLSDENKEQTTRMKIVVEKVFTSLKVVRPEVELRANLEEVVFRGTEETWRIVVENIVENALRYAKSNITITLTEGQLAISNDGPFIAMETIDKLFKPYQVGTGGKFGLGLSIVSRICTAYRYSVKAENLNDGVIFRIEDTVGGKHKAITTSVGRSKNKAE